MPVDVFGHAMDFQIRSMLQRIEADGAGKGGVHRQQGPVCMCNGSNSVQVADTRGGISRGFHMDELCVGAYGGPYGVGIRGVQKGNFHAIFFRQIFPEQKVGGAVADLGNDGMVAAIKESGKGRR